MVRDVVHVVTKEVQLEVDASWYREERGVKCVGLWLDRSRVGSAVGVL